MLLDETTMVILLSDFAILIWVCYGLWGTWEWVKGSLGNKKAVVLTGEVIDEKG